MDQLQINAFDIIVAAVVITGIMVGRKRGISHELLDMAQWVAIIVAGAFAYQPLGVALATYTKMPQAIANVFGYIVAAVIVMLVFTSLKRAVGAKLVESDTFGRFEYYLGMIAGALRFACVMLFLLAILHAKYTTPAQRAAQKKMQKDNFGDITLPTIESVQEWALFESRSGKFVGKHLDWAMIEPVSPGGQRGGANIYERRQRTVEDAMK